jgi:hypothetical protein
MVNIVRIGGAISHFGQKHFVQRFARRFGALERRRRGNWTALRGGAEFRGFSSFEQTDALGPYQQVEIGLK